MLTISNLTLILSKPNKIYITNKQLKISAGIYLLKIGITTANTKSIAKSSGEGQIYWEDVLAIPVTTEINF
jgi:hypothetical protein